MLKLFTGNKVDHPMADAKKAREIIADLPADPLKALEEITHWLEGLKEVEAFRLERLFENVDLLDAAAKNHQRKLAQEYFLTSRQQKFQENRLWTINFAFWKALCEGYLECVRRFESGQTGGIAFRKNMASIVARALRALTLLLKWVLVRYGPVDPKIWNDAGRLLQLAEASGFLDTQIEIYPGSHGGGTVQREFLKLAMLAVSSTDGLSPVKQEIAERSVANFSDGFRLSRTPAAGCNYCFDMTSGKPPYRLVSDQSSKPGVRYFGAGEGMVQLTAVEAKTRETGVLPTGVYIGGDYSKDLLLPVFRHLMAYWSEDPPARANERRKTASRLTVVHGINELMAALNPGTGDDLDFSDPESSAESWIVENVSDGGYGAIIPATRSDWVRVGALIGLKSEVSQHWGIGIVRRVTRDEHQQRRVGIQVLSKVAVPAQVCKSGSYGEGSDPAILLSTSPDAQGEVGVILREGYYNARDSLDLTVKGKGFLLIPGRLAEGGEDFDWAMFKVMTRSD